MNTTTQWTPQAKLSDYTVPEYKYKTHVEKIILELPSTKIVYIERKVKRKRFGIFPYTETYEVPVQVSYIPKCVLVHLTDEMEYEIAEYTKHLKKEIVSISRVYGNVDKLVKGEKITVVPYIVEAETYFLTCWRLS
jgi:hypothetical protein